MRKRGGRPAGGSFQLISGMSYSPSRRGYMPRSLKQLDNVFITRRRGLPVIPFMRTTRCFLGLARRNMIRYSWRG